jgi:hypothetical protein
VGAKPRNIEVSRDKRLFSEKSGRTIEKPVIRQFQEVTNDMSFKWFKYGITAFTFIQGNKKKTDMYYTQ